MMIRDLITETYAALSGNKARSGLTMLGIIIGISSVIVLVGVGQGATSSVTSRIAELGTNLLTVSPGASRNAGPVSGGAGSATTLTKADAEAIKSTISDVAAIATELSRRYQVTYKGSNTNTQVIGTEPSYPSIRNVTVASGAFFSEQQVTNYAKVAVIGPMVRDDLFGAETDPVGMVIKINKIQFTIIGMTTAKGGSGFNNADQYIYVPITAAQRFLAGRTSISSIDVQAANEKVTTSVKEQISSLLLERHNISDATQADFTIVNQADLVSSLSSVTSTLTLLLGAIASISLVVGGIGIMNMMLTSVTERTREIGLRKAIGAKRGDISIQFLSEAVTLTFLGGAIGILLGWAIASIITGAGLVTAKVTWTSVGMAFSVAAIVGILFGFYPARRAASLRPIEALKFE